MAEGSKSGNDKTTVLVAIDGSEHAENAFRCKLNNYYAWNVR